MNTSSYILIPQTTFGSNDDNYEGGATLNGIPQKAAAYYSKDKTSQTISWFLTTGFQGTLTIEATLDLANDTTNYFPIHVLDYSATPLLANDYDFANLVGNYTWVRAVVTDYQAGAISKVAMGY